MALFKNEQLKWLYGDYLMSLSLFLFFEFGGFGGFLK